MGNQVTPLAQQCLENSFSNTINFDEVYVFDNGKIGNTEKNAITFKGKQTICLCICDQRSFSYVVTLDPSSEITLYICFAKDSSSELHIHCLDNVICKNIIMQQNSAFQRIYVNQGKYSTYEAGYFQLNGKNDTIELYLDKNGEQANTDLYGVFFPNQNEKYTISTYVKHKMPYCETTELFRGIADNEGTGTFSGVIYVARNAQKTNAKQQNRNILLSKTAHIHSEPQLEIYADDVVCNHGSSTGQIDSEALWYMQARGINKEKATKLLVSSFANDVLEKISNESLRQKIATMIAEKLGNN